MLVRSCLSEIAMLRFRGRCRMLLQIGRPSISIGKYRGLLLIQRRNRLVLLRLLRK